jgi:hypothetical protein
MIQSTPSPLSPTKVVAHGMDNVDEMIHRGVVMRIFTKLYTMAKLMQMILLSYGVEVFYETVLLPCAPPSLSPSPNN